MVYQREKYQGCRNVHRHDFPGSAVALCFGNPKPYGGHERVERNGYDVGHVHAFCHVFWVVYDAHDNQREVDGQQQASQDESRDFGRERLEADAKHHHRSNHEQRSKLQNETACGHECFVVVEIRNSFVFWLEERAEYHEDEEARRCRYVEYAEQNVTACLLLLQCQFLGRFLAWQQETLIQQAGPSDAAEAAHQHVEEHVAKQREAQFGEEKHGCKQSRYGKDNQSQSVSFVAANGQQGEECNGEEVAERVYDAIGCAALYVGIQIIVSAFYASELPDAVE